MAVMTIAIVVTVVVPHLPDVARLLAAAVAGPGPPIAAAVVMEAVTGPLPAEVIRAEAGVGLHPRVIDHPALVLLEIGRMDPRPLI